MHFVTGGHFNGKRNWVFEHYGFDRERTLLISPFYDKDALRKIDSIENFEQRMIIEGLDRLIIATVERDHPRAYWQEMFSRWEQWVLQDKNRQLIVIGSDISKGIVPTDPHQRNGRDLVGFCYQDLVKKCKRVDLVWYGINQTLKED